MTSKPAPPAQEAILGTGLPNAESMERKRIASRWPRGAAKKCSSSASLGKNSRPEFGCTSTPFTADDRLRSPRPQELVCAKQAFVFKTRSPPICAEEKKAPPWTTRARTGPTSRGDLQTDPEASRYRRVVPLIEGFPKDEATELADPEKHDLRSRSPEGVAPAAPN